MLEKATELLGAEMLGQLENSNWKERLAGMENFTTMIRRMSKDMIPCQVCVRSLAKKPGFKDNNFQVSDQRNKISILIHLLFAYLYFFFCVNN